MTPDLFCRIGEALYGPNWRQTLATRLGVNVRSVQRWGSGSHPIPDYLVARLCELLVARQVDISGLIREIPAP